MQSKYAGYVAGIVQGHISAKNIPVLVTLCVTSKCNLKCIYCYKENQKENHKEFTTDELLNLVDELKSMGTKYISLNGGEALLRDDIEDVINKIREKGMLCHLSTNGMLIKKKIPILKKVDSIALSIDGMGMSNDSNRGKDTCERLLGAIEALNNNNIAFHTHTVLTRNNKNALQELMPLAQKYGFKAQFSVMRAEDSPNKEIGLNDPEAKEIIKKIMDYKKLYNFVFFSHKAYKNMLDWPFSYEKQAVSSRVPSRFKPITCFIKRFSCHIEPDGMVYPCIVLVDKFKALNLHDAGFKKAWENLSHNTCKACYNICLSDLNLIFGLKPDSIWNAFKIVMKRRMKGTKNDLKRYC